MRGVSRRYRDASLIISDPSDLLSVADAAGTMANMSTADPRPPIEPLPDPLLPPPQGVASAVHIPAAESPWTAIGAEQPLLRQSRNQAADRLETWSVTLLMVILLGAIAVFTVGLLVLMLGPFPTSC
jgi:hypothetical protein